MKIKINNQKSIGILKVPSLKHNTFWKKKITVIHIAIREKILFQKMKFFQIRR